VKHWLENLANELGPHANIDLDINVMREVTLRVSENRAGMVYEIEQRISWKDFENAVADPLIFSADSIMDEWRKLSPWNQ